jgi:hypothetical protein
MLALSPTTKATRAGEIGHLQKDGFKMFEILPHLHLSKFPTEIPTGITHILNMCGIPHPFDSTRTYLHIPLNDIDNITPHIGKIIDFIENALRGDGNILVHCALGLNRSASAILTYLCHRNHTNSTDALAFLQERKQDVEPSVIFLKQIDQFFNREVLKEDPLVGFHRRLQERKKRGGFSCNS